MRLSRAGIGAAALLAALVVTGCQTHTTPPPAPSSAGTSADPLADIEATLDAVEHDLDTDAAG